MNRSLFRLVKNRRFGMLVPVPEFATAVSTGGDGSSKRKASDGSEPEPGESIAQAVSTEDPDNPLHIAKRGVSAAHQAASKVAKRISSLLDQDSTACRFSGPKQSLQPPVKRRLLFEALEQRLLMAAGPLPAFVAAQVDGSIDVPGSSNRYTVNLTADTKIVVDSLTNNSQINWTLDGPRGNVVAARSLSATDGADFGSANPVLDLAAGSYTFTVDGVAESTGAYSFRLLDLSKAVAVTPGTPVSQVMTYPNETELYKFDGAAGDHFFLDVTNRTGGGQLRWQLLDPYGKQVFAPTAKIGRAHV